ncbi:MAG TPA: dTDP-4-dehydrorhamnose reductase [Alphaproteobacteria bacterium]|nr:dTDP-4-dehydrorhamnose reductase [Alphaproteobacteria bacterium]
MDIAVIGANGQLGTDLVRVFRERGHEVIPFVRAQFDVADARAVRRVLVELHPQAVITCAAFNRVDECEDRPDEAFRVNALGALHVARACTEVDALCAYISTDFVFDGTKGAAYVEDDAPAPVNVYGASKLAGEHLVRQTAGRWLIGRVASLFGAAGSSGKGGNFVETILARARSGQPLRVIDDITMSPTYTVDAARLLETLVTEGATGVVHLANAGACTWFEFARRICQLAGIPAEVNPVPSSAYPSKARRPPNSALATARLSRWGAYPRPWEEALLAYLVEKGYVGAEAVG